MKKHFIYRDHADGDKIVLACDAEDIEAADREFEMRLGQKPGAFVGAEFGTIVTGNGGVCLLPHTVGVRFLIRSAPEVKPKSAGRTFGINLSPCRIPNIRLFQGVTARQFHMACFYCGVDMEGHRAGEKQRTKDHVTPKSQGGKTKVPCCKKCNILKGSLRLEEYRVIVAYRNGLIPLEVLQQVKFKGEELAGFEVDP